MTVAGASAGYAPPEQYEVGNRRVSQRTDVFAFGAILFEVLSGCEAFPVGAGRDRAAHGGAHARRRAPGAHPAQRHHPARAARSARAHGGAGPRDRARTDGDPAKRHGSIEELWGAVEPLLRAVTGGSSNVGKALGSAASSAPQSSAPAVPAPRKSTPSVAPLIPQPAPSVSRSSAPDPIAGAPRVRASR